MRRYNYEKQVEKWDVLEVTVEGHFDKNPFVCRLSWNYIHSK